MQNENSRRLADHEVNEMLRQYKLTGKSEIRDRIVLQYTNLVESVARRFAGAAEPAEDLVQEGYIGLITAVEGFNSGKGVKFSTYATHFIIGQIKHCLRDRGKIIKEPAWLQELNQRVTKVIETLSQDLGRIPSNGEIGSMVGMSEDAVTDLLTTREVFKVASLDGGGEQDEETSSSYDSDRVKTDKAVEFQLSIEEKVVLETALNKLKHLEQTVIHEFYFKDRNQTEIAKALGISCNYVSHILRNSTRKLKKIMVTDELRESQLEMALLRKRVEEQSRAFQDNVIVDSQTRLYNKKYFENRLVEEISRSSRYGYQVSVLIVELGGSDQISRAYGTIKAEDTMRKSAMIIQEGVRKVDIVTRFSETTFALILPYTGESVSIVDNRLRTSLANMLLEMGLISGRAPVLLRTGYATAPDDAALSQELIDRSMMAMNQAQTLEELPMAA